MPERRACLAREEKGISLHHMDCLDESVERRRAKDGNCSAKSYEAA